MLTRRQILGSLLAALATPCVVQAAGGILLPYAVHLSTGFDDSGSMGISPYPSPRQVQLNAWADAMESPEFAATLQALPPGTRVLFDAFYWSARGTIMFLKPVVIEVDNPRPALGLIALVLRREAQTRVTMLAGDTYTSVGFGYGLNNLLQRGAPKKVLNLVTDDDVRETDAGSLALLAGLQLVAWQNKVRVNVLVIGNADANRTYFEEHVMAGPQAVVLGTNNVAEHKTAWCQKFRADLA